MAGFANLQLHVARRGYSDLNAHRQFRRTEALGFHPHHVVRRNQSSRRIRSGGTGTRIDDLSRRLIGDGDLRSVHDGPTWVGNCSLDATGRDGRLSSRGCCERKDDDDREYRQAKSCGDTATGVQIKQHRPPSFRVFHANSDR